jgi:hypothetical protein
VLCIRLLKPCRQPPYLFVRRHFHAEHRRLLHAARGGHASRNGLDSLLLLLLLLLTLGLSLLLVLGGTALPALRGRGRSGCSTRTSTGADSRC